ncbi:Crp/Fnr family transcriptional regulator [Fusobacterium sp.]|uniref:Crp/Fnr family transcriptional regulator n=1 Tax=Fusobacterium sp. TaxID=68766 RepID=UPI0025C31A81|nr:Crp/Fnr family transcriptional regulator [Fusobacterium sp.]
MKSNGIQNIDLLKNISKIENLKVLEGINYQILSYKKNEYVAFRGDLIKGLYVNIEGNLVAEMSKEDGNIKKIEELRNGTIIASAFIFGKNNKFPVDLIAQTDVKILFIEKEELIKLLLSNSEILVNLLDDISNKAQFLSKNLWESVSNKTISEKLSKYILKNEREGVVILDKTIKELAEYFNVSRPSLSRSMKILVDQGVIERVEKGRYRVIDREKLKSFK